MTVYVYSDPVLSEDQEITLSRARCSECGETWYPGERPLARQLDHECDLPRVVGQELARSVWPIIESKQVQAAPDEP